MLSYMPIAHDFAAFYSATGLGGFSLLANDAYVHFAREFLSSFTFSFNNETELYTTSFKMYENRITLCLDKILQVCFASVISTTCTL
jgi:hypothetical protein